jgi:hypothetical protein
MPACSPYRGGRSIAGGAGCKGAGGGALAQRVYASKIRFGLNGAGRRLIQWRRRHGVLAAGWLRPPVGRPSTGSVCSLHDRALGAVRSPSRGRTPPGARSPPGMGEPRRWISQHRLAPRAGRFSFYGMGSLLVLYLNSGLLLPGRFESLYGLGRRRALRQTGRRLGRHTGALVAAVGCLRLPGVCDAHRRWRASRRHPRPPRHASLRRVPHGVRPRMHNVGASISGRARPRGVGERGFKPSVSAQARRRPTNHFSTCPPACLPTHS